MIEFKYFYIVNSLKLMIIFFVSLLIKFKVYSFEVVWFKFLLLLKLKKKFILINIFFIVRKYLKYISYIKI